MLSVLTTPQFTAVTTFIIHLILLNCTLNPNIRTIVVYHDNQSSHEFIDAMLDTLSKVKPLVVINVTEQQTLDYTTIGHQIIHVFIWKDLNITKHLSQISLIQNSETIIFVFEESHDKSNVEAFSINLWKMYKLFNTILVYNNESNDIDSITYRPFEAKFSTVKEVSHVIEQNLYGQTLSSVHFNMERFNISVLMVLRSPNVLRLSKNDDRFGGRDGQMAVFLSNFYNATFNYVTNATLKLLVVQKDDARNFTKFVPVHEVENSDVFVVDDEVRPMALNVSSDILMNSRMCCDISNNYISFYPHEFDSYVVVVPSATSFVSLHHIYHPNTFWLGSVAIVIFSLIWIFFQFVLYHERTFFEYQNTFLEVLGICLLTKAAKVSDFISERVLVTFILFFATVMSIIEAAVIYDNFVKDIALTEINTLKELENIKYRILISPDAKVLMEFRKVSEKLQKKFILTDNNDLTYQILTGNTSQCYVLRRSRAESLLQRYSLQRDGYTIFHIVKEPLLPSLRSYYAHNDFPFTDDFDQLVQRSIEYGFLQHFDVISKYKLYFNDNRRKEIDIARKDEGKIIEMSEIMSTLTIFITGMSISTIVFLFELVWARLEPRVKKWIKLRKEIDLIKEIGKQNQGFLKEPLFEFVE